jgi:hypothetical protein
LPRKPSGYAFLTDNQSGRVIKEIDTLNCGHCRRICHPEFKAEPGDNFGHCNRCDRDICANCATKMERGAMCDVWEEKNKRLEAALERQMALGSYGI